jgi:hypothetical protein
MGTAQPYAAILDPASNPADAVHTHAVITVNDRECDQRLN